MTAEARAVSLLAARQLPRRLAPVGRDGGRARTARDGKGGAGQRLAPVVVLPCSMLADVSTGCPVVIDRVAWLARDIVSHRYGAEMPAMVEGVAWPSRACTQAVTFFRHAPTSFLRSSYSPVSRALLQA